MKNSEELGKITKSIMKLAEYYVAKALGYVTLIQTVILKTAEK